MPLAAANLLDDETSPYLQQHRDNPVHWRPWSRAALDEAHELDKPILLSIGYAACHWCHVMAHESFEDPDIAGLMNRLFVNIKVDREERPDIDQIFMAALNATGEQGGWPLTMFLTPDAQPFWGGTYFPNTPRFGRASFPQVLQAIHRAWTEKRDEIRASAAALSGHVEARLAALPTGGGFSGERFATLADSVLAMIDPVEGGLQGAPKFPNAPLMETLWLSWLSTGEPARRDAVLLSLRHMLLGGIYDHLGGGLSRYATDAGWAVPHFEKMLYDNAQLIRLASWAYAETEEELFRVRTEETIGWLAREMRVPGGAFAASLDADSDGEEGKFYTWSAAALEAVLGPDTPVFLTDYALATAPHWEGDPVLRRRAFAAEREPVLAPLRAKLLAARAARLRPRRDDKVLVDWNGMAIAAIAAAARLFGRDDWLQLARDAYADVLRFRDGDRLPHAILGEKAAYPGLSSDHAGLALAAAALHQATGGADTPADALGFCGALDRWHGDGEAGHFLTASDSRDVPFRIRGDVDEAIPSATSQVILAKTMAAQLAADPDQASGAQATAEAAFGRVSQQPFGQAGIYNACLVTLSATKLVIVEDEAGRRPLRQVADRNPDPRRTDLFLPLGTDPEALGLPPGTLLDTRRAAAYLCTATSCQAPVMDPAALETLLKA